MAAHNIFCPTLISREKIMSQLFWPFSFDFTPEAYAGEVKKGYIYVLVHRGICEGYCLGSRGN